jgi:putative methionine-R-sulfoxide reductase with GAF domain
MDSHSILDHDGEAPESNAPGSQSSVRFPGEDGGKSLAEMAERDLTATLQLLAERAQYITGATGAAIALRDHEEMVCRASAGPSAPEVGAQLQVNSGLSGESVRTRQTLRCDDSNTDTRVNRESCEALGIRSVVVMPLLRGDEVIGVFELFSDQANIFETRDLAALERMGAMVHTALEHSASALGLDPLPADQVTSPSLPEAGNGHQGEILEGTFGNHNGAGMAAPLAPSENFSTVAGASQPFEVPSSALNASPGVAFHLQVPPAPTELSPRFAEMVAIRRPAGPAAVSPIDESDVLEDPADDILISELEVAAQQAPALADHVQEAVAHPAEPVSRGTVAGLRACESCGFPVSEGRNLCLDCEKKIAQAPPPAPPAQVLEAASSKSIASAPSPSVDDVPNFLGAEPEASWLSRHKLMVVAIVVAVIGIVAVVFLR